MTTLLEALADMRHYIRCGPESPEQCPACVRYDALQVEVLKAIEELAEARRERDALREMVDSTKVAAWDKCAEIIRRAQAAEAERDRLREALDNLLSACELPGEHCEIEQAIPRARAALEGKP